MARPRGTAVGDLVLIHFQGRPATFARVEDVRPQGRPGWFFCDLLVLTVPPQPMTWILEREQIDGTGFTMGGQPVRIERAPDVGALHEELRRVEAAKAKSDGAAAEAGAEEGEAPGEAAVAVPGSGEHEPRRPPKVVPFRPRK